MQGPSRLEAGSGNSESAAMARELHGGTNRLDHCHLDYYVLNFGAHTINVWLSFLNGKIGQSQRVNMWESSFQVLLLSGSAPCRDWSSR